MKWVGAYFTGITIRTNLSGLLVVTAYSISTKALKMDIKINVFLAAAIYVE
jgi:hypothetical protein